MTKTLVGDKDYGFKNNPRFHVRSHYFVCRTFFRISVSKQLHSFVVIYCSGTGSFNIHCMSLVTSVCILVLFIVS